MGLFSSIAKNVIAGPIAGMAGGDSPFLGNNNAMDMIPGIGDARAQERANEANIDQARLNRDFQERMSSTAYQRAMDDMQKAGLNPMLAYIQGGASAPSGSTAQVESASKTGLADMALKATTGVGGLQQQATALRQQESVNQSQIQLNAANTAKQAAETQKIQQETKGLGRKAAEGELWDKLYRGINRTLDSSAKEIKQRGISDWLFKPKEKEIKVLGPAKSQVGRIKRPQ